MSLRLHRAEITKHNSIDDAWVIVDGAVHDVTAFLESHPGDLSVGEEHLGTDVSRLIRSDEVHSHCSMLSGLCRGCFIPRFEFQLEMELVPCSHRS